ncbi:uncharacterized protein LY79DRAFT_570560 [Colletotrichum navitas]|uniref:Uncharacterized protein n=1 Tax=Colletotrichum navitas TaxID=681940 RepID=A0AAD8UX38_9PEZI|nr:uncharacterized protein LY79DRAFT_570560 [Colletotrichum navitas]KAK1570045.1 hypothetical protein LY79DRAFT_570560 [Colletotrichum navitas]
MSSLFTQSIRTSLDRPHLVVHFLPPLTHRSLPSLFLHQRLVSQLALNHPSPLALFSVQNTT